MKHEIKKQESGFLGAIMASMAPALLQPLISSLVKCITERGVRRTGKGIVYKSVIDFWYAWPKWSIILQV